VRPTDLLQEQKASCSRCKAGLLCEKYNQLEDLPHECDNVSKEVGFTFHSYCLLNNIFAGVYLHETTPIDYHCLSQIFRQTHFQNLITRIWKLP
jgi:hypothetical protein